MSVAPNIIWCERCNFETTTAVIWGVFKYRFSDGSEIQVERSAGWCSACNSIQPVEKSTDRSKLLKKYEDLQKELARLQKSFVRTLLKFDKREIADIKYECQEIEDQLRLLDVRRGPQRCLTCGSTEIAVIDLPSIGEEEIRKVDFCHPGCGGMLKIRKSHIRYSMNFPKKVYDVEGNRILEK